MKLETFEAPVRIGSVEERLEVLLARTSLFGRLGLEDRRALAVFTTSCRFERGEVLFAEGDPPLRFFLLLEGNVKVSKLTPAGREVILHLFGPGEPVGAIAVYEGRPYFATARSLEPTRALSVPREPFFRLLAERPTLLGGLLSGLSTRLMVLTERLVEVTGGRVEERLARVLLHQLEERGRPERGGTFVPLHLSRQELADLAGTTLETAIRIMSRWGRKQWVVTEPEGFLVLDRGALEERAQGGDK